MSEPVFPWNEIERLKEESNSKKEFYERMRYLLNESIDMLALSTGEHLDYIQISLNALLDLLFEDFEDFEKEN